MIERAEEEELEMDSFDKLLALEARIQDEKKLNAEAIAELRKDLKEVLEKITELIPLLETARSISLFARGAERFFVWLAKVSAGFAIVYGAYKFGLAEIALRVQNIGK